MHRACTALVAVESDAEVCSRGAAARRLRSGVEVRWRMLERAVDSRSVDIGCSDESRSDFRTHLPLRTRLAYRETRAILRRAPTALRRRFIEAWRERRYVGEVSVEGLLMVGETGRGDGSVVAPACSLASSPHVELLQLYDRYGERIFCPAFFQRTRYHAYAATSVQRFGHPFFGHTTTQGYLAQARAFVALYERMRTGDVRELSFPSSLGHSAPGSLPVVQRTWAKGVLQVVNGHHRLAIATMLGHAAVRAVVLPPKPTPLQRLAAACANPPGTRELYQPLPTLDFDDSWPALRRCDDRLALMLACLEEWGQRISGLSVLDLGCSYGWFVDQFTKRGAQARGVEQDQRAVLIGRSAYGLRTEQQ